MLVDRDIWSPSFYYHTVHISVAHLHVFGILDSDLKCSQKTCIICIIIDWWKHPNSVLHFVWLSDILSVLYFQVGLILTKRSLMLGWVPLNTKFSYSLEKEVHLYMCRVFDNEHRALQLSEIEAISILGNRIDHSWLINDFLIFCWRVNITAWGETSFHINFYRCG